MFKLTIATLEIGGQTNFLPTNFHCFNCYYNVPACQLSALWKTGTTIKYVVKLKFYLNSVTSPELIRRAMEIMKDNGEVEDEGY